MTEKVTSDFYKRVGKELTNCLFDKRILNDDLNRETMDWLEDLLGFYVQSYSEQAAKTAVLVASFRSRK